MDSIEQLGDNARWTAAEKKVARRAFDQALERHLSAIIAEAKRMMANVANPSDLWGVEAYLTESRKTVDRIYQFRYSHLLRVFSVSRQNTPHTSTNIQQSEGFDSDSIIHGFAESLLATQVFLCRLYRDVAKEKLNLFQFAT